LPPSVSYACRRSPGVGSTSNKKPCAGSFFLAGSGVGDATGSGAFAAFASSSVLCQR
jgi:hypothetical protein